MTSPPDRSPELPRAQAISLDELTEAFAQAMGYRPAQGTPEAEAPAPELSPATSREEPAACAEPLAPATEEDACPITPASILEAMLFVGSPHKEPLTAQRAAELMRGVEVGEVPGLVDDLNRRYQQRGCPYEIISEGVGYRLTIRRPFHRLRERFYGKLREARLSQAAIDILALVAYRQPIQAEEISQLRGKPSARLLAQLVRRGLLRVERSGEKPRVTHYATAERFLQLFGLESLDDLPHSEELDRQ